MDRTTVTLRPAGPTGPVLTTDDPEIVAVVLDAIARRYRSGGREPRVLAVHDPDDAA